MRRIALAVSLLIAVQAESQRVRIPAGSYQPLYTHATHGRMHVASFAIDRYPVTRGDFASFVARNPAWQRGRVGSALAEPSYLADWPAPADAGAAEARQPVTNVSWFAASAYCAATGGRLPTVDEWEYIAAASTTQRDGSRESAASDRLLAVYTARSARAGNDVRSIPVNAFGVAALHELVWEWTADYASQRAQHMYCASSAIGATDPGNHAAFLRYAFRSGLTDRSTTRSLGFRCAA